MTNTLTFSAITIDCRDPQRSAEFWQAAIGGQLRSSDDDAFLEPFDGSPRMHFHRTNTPYPSPSSLHLDFRVEWGERERQATRLADAGATIEWEVIDQYPGMRWTTMSDPDGNLFCITEIAA